MSLLLYLQKLIMLIKRCAMEVIILIVVVVVIVGIVNGNKAEKEKEKARQAYISS